MGMEEYNLNEDFRQYVDKYCKKHNVTPEQAVEHKLVQYVLEEYKHRRVDYKQRTGGESD